MTQREDQPQERGCRKNDQGPPSWAASQQALHVPFPALLSRCPLVDRRVPTPVSAPAGRELPTWAWSGVLQPCRAGPANAQTLLGPAQSEWTAEGPGARGMCAAPGRRIRGSRPDAGRRQAFSAPDRQIRNCCGLEGPRTPLLWLQAASWGWGGRQPRERPQEKDGGLDRRAPPRTMLSFGLAGHPTFITKHTSDPAPS